MKTVLIVDDEKNDRQMLKSMIQESGVPVGVVMECGDGEAAYEILREQEIDVMFMDIHMPVLDGIGLMRKVKGLPVRPLVVAVSRYGDFACAVELMRCGVQDYFLKPVSHEQIARTMEKFESQVILWDVADRTNRKMGYQQIKYLLLNRPASNSGSGLLEEYPGGEYINSHEYLLCVWRHSGLRFFTVDGIYLENVGGNDVLITSARSMGLLLKNELANDFVGLSNAHSGIGELWDAYDEAMENRRVAFFTSTAFIGGKGGYRVPDKLKETAKKLLATEACSQRIQILGTDKTQELSRIWELFFWTARKLQFTPEEFEGAVVKAISDIQQTYPYAAGSAEGMERLRAPWSWGSLDEYQKAFFAFLLQVHEWQNEHYDSSLSQRKMQEALAYIRENYAKDLNMAVVSNYVSMNYSFFSYTFKQYTGTNFVNYLRNIRMEEARRLLQQSELKVNEIGRNVGYHNEKHFLKTFKSYFGVSPSEYRKNTDPNHLT